MNRKYKINKGFLLLELLTALMIFSMVITMMYMVSSYGKNSMENNIKTFIPLFFSETVGDAQQYGNNDVNLNLKMIQEKFPLSSRYLEKNLSQYQTYSQYDKQSNQNVSESSFNTVNLFPTSIGGLSILVKTDSSEKNHYTLKYDGVSYDDCSSFIKKLINSRENVDNSSNTLSNYDVLVNQVEFQPISISQETKTSIKQICQNKTNNTISISN